MTQLDEAAQPADGSAQPSDSSVPDVLARHTARVRRARIWYYGIVLVVIALAVAFVAVVYSHGESAHASLKPAATQAPALPVATLSATPKLAWQSPDATAIGVPSDSGVVVTYSAHTVTGRNARTGTAIWSYTRTDRTVCQVAQLQSKTLAIYQDGPNCDEVTALNTARGTRSNERTLTDNGHPTFIALSDTLLIVTPAAVHAVDPLSLVDRFDYLKAADCSKIVGAAGGTAGVLISQDCVGGTRLFLRDRYLDDNSKVSIKWNILSNALPVSADGLISALDTSGRLVTYDPGNGAVLHQNPLTGSSRQSTPVTTAAASDGELIQLGATVHLVNAQGVEQWTSTVGGIATLIADDGADSTPAIGNAQVFAPVAAGVQALSAATGQVTKTYPLTSTTTSAGRVYRVGSGFLVGGTATALYQ
jgi:hypothetical protein